MEDLEKEKSILRTIVLHRVKKVEEENERLKKRKFYLLYNKETKEFVISDDKETIDEKIRTLLNERPFCAYEELEDKLSGEVEEYKQLSEDEVDAIITERIIPRMWREVEESGDSWTVTNRWRMMRYDEEYNIHLMLFKMGEWTDSADY